MPETPWPTQVKDAVARWAAWGRKQAWVVAVSGGGDSVALLRALHEFSPRVGLKLSVAHLDHGARGEASKRDAAFVEDLARALGLPFDLGHWQASRPGHFEADARRARYAWLAQVARDRGATVVAVGHTRDDQAETVLHRVIRGTGLRGLAGIPARRSLGDGVTLVRPLLTVSRADLRNYLDFLGQPFRDDASNADTSRTRARLRHDLLPKLAAEYNPRVADALVRLSRIAASAERLAHKEIVTSELRANLEAGAGLVRLRRDELMGHPRSIRVEILRLAWRRAGWPEAGMSAARWRRIVDLVRRTREVPYDVGGGVVAVPGKAVFTLRKSVPPVSPPVAPEALPLEVPGSTPWPGGRIVVTLDPDSPRAETIDVDRLVLPLTVRAPRPGDRFNPLGMGTRETPLNDFFRGRRVSRGRRLLIPLVCDALGVVWVVGHRISQRVALTDTSTRRAGLGWEPDPSPR